MQKMLNPARKASTHFHLILSMASLIGYKKRVPLPYGLTKNMGIGKLDLKTTLVPAQVVFTAMPMSISHKMPQIWNYYITDNKTWIEANENEVYAGSNTKKRRDIVDEYLTLTILQLWKN